MQKKLSHETGLHNILSISHVKDTVSRLEEDVDEIPIQDSIGRMQNTPIINESSLYNVILCSNKPEAKLFRKWVM